MNYFWTISCGYPWCRNGTYCSGHGLGLSGNKSGKYTTNRSQNMNTYLIEWDDKQAQLFMEAFQLFSYYSPLY